MWTVYHQELEAYARERRTAAGEPAAEDPFTALERRLQGGGGGARGPAERGSS